MATATNDTDKGLSAPQPKREVKVVHDDGPLAHIFDTARFEQLQRVAAILAAGSLTPSHLVVTYMKDGQKLVDETATKANCFRVANQAIRWGFDPFAVADASYVVGGKLGYEGKLVAAVINARAGVVRPLRYEHSGSGDGRKVLVIGRLQGEDEDRTVELTVGQAKTKNDMWTKDPDQKLCYSGAIRWARRHKPEVIMGVLTDDDLDRIGAKDAEPSTIEQLVENVEQTQVVPSVEHEIKTAAANEPKKSRKKQEPQDASEQGATDGAIEHPALTTFRKWVAKQSDADAIWMEADKQADELPDLAEEIKQAATERCKELQAPAKGQKELLP